MNLLFANDARGEYPHSLYADTRASLAEFKPLRGDVRADVAIVGAGYTGLSAALHLARSGYRVVVLEAHRVGFGASGRNGGQMCSGQRQEVDWLEQHYGADTARRMWDLAEDAKTLVRSLAAASNVPIRAGIAHACRSQAEIDHSARVVELLTRRYDYNQIQQLDQSELAVLLGSDHYLGGAVDRGAGHLQPLDLAIGIAQQATAAGALLYENSSVQKIRHGDAITKSVVEAEHGRVTCDHVILAANGYLGDLNRNVAARVMPINNYIVATEPLGDLAPEILPEQNAASDSKFVVNYWRMDDQRRLIFGGGETLGYRFPTDIASLVRPHLLSIYPQLQDVKLTHAWGGTLAITMNRMPYFARPAANCLSASGFSGHGLALATLAGKLMAMAIAGQANGFDTMASITTRPFPGGSMLRGPLLVAGMAWYGLRDRLGL